LKTGVIPTILLTPAKWRPDRSNGLPGRFSIFVTSRKCSGVLDGTENARVRFPPINARTRAIRCPVD
jgi:hypothetical protein